MHGQVPSLHLPYIPERAWWCMGPWSRGSVVEVEPEVADADVPVAAADGAGAAKEFGFPVGVP